MTPRLRNLADAARSAAEGIASTGAMVLVVFGIIAACTHGDPGGLSSGFGLAVILVAGAFGAPAHIATSSTVRSTGIGFLNADTPDTPKFAVTTTVRGEVHATVWLITFAFVLLLALLAGRGEAARPSGSLRRLLARAAAAAIGATGTLVLLALLGRGSDALMSRLAAATDLTLTPGPGAIEHGTDSALTGWLLLGPPLAAFTAACLGRFFVVSRRPAVGAGDEPPPSRLARFVGAWRAAASVVVIQSCVALALGAAIVSVFAAAGSTEVTDATLNNATSASGLVAFAGDNAVTGVLLGAGARLSSLVSATVGAVQIRVFPVHYAELGFFTADHPAELDVLAAAVLFASACPALRAVLRPRPGDRTDFEPRAAWRAALLGAACGAAAGSIGLVSSETTHATTGSFGGAGIAALPGAFGQRVSFGLLGPVLALAAWATLAYLAAALVVRVRAQRDADRAPVRPPDGMTVFEQITPDDDLGAGTGRLVLLDEDPLASAPLEMLPRGTEG